MKAFRYGYGLLTLVSLCWLSPALMRVPLHSTAGLRQIQTVYDRSLIPQRPLDQERTYDEQARPGQPHQIINDVAWALFGFNVSIGSPAQSIRLALSIETPNLMMQSIDCDTEVCQRNHTGFNASRSTTFDAVGPPFYGEWFGWAAWSGRYAQETVGIASQALTNLPFMLGDNVDVTGWLKISWYFGYDGVLGVTPNSPILHELKNQRHIDGRIFSISLPSEPVDIRDPGARTGELILGGSDPSYPYSNFMSFPLASDDLWTTYASSVTYGNETTQLPFTSLALFATASPFISLPRPFGSRLLKQVSDHLIGMMLGFPIFDCSLLDHLSNVTLTLGRDREAREITLTPSEYTVHVIDKGGDLTCVMPVMDSRDMGVELGWPVLKKFYAVFDAEESKIMWPR